MKGSNIIIGRRDRIDLPELGLRNIKAKIDTGAYGSAIHCSQIEVIIKNNRKLLTFVLLDPGYPGFSDQKYYFEHYKDKLVKSSSGESEHRYIIATDVIIFGQAIKTEFSLTDRSQMKYPILLGRKFLRKHFLVDVSLKEVSYKLKRSMTK
jgi:hypothetical protein